MTSFDAKEDLRLRMADLEKKLAESEEERCKLEKTCNVLMRAFREEEKMKYKTLNKNYEKFLQDCTVRKRRNNIILRSLCRIEDRSRALFAKTERLKLLKDRYISYLKINDIKHAVSYHTGKILPQSSSSQKISEVTQKFVQWKTPLSTDYVVEHLKDAEENSFESNKIPDATYSLVSVRPCTSHEKYSPEQRKEVETNGISPVRGFNAQNKLYSMRNILDSPSATPVKSEELINQENYGVLKNNKNNAFEVKDLIENTVSRGRDNLSHQESIEKLKKTDESLDHENIDVRHDLVTKKIVDTEENEKNAVEKENKPHDGSLPGINIMMTSRSSTCDEENQDNVGMESKRESREENVSTSGLPMGLDGIDYENETYPESYYEQPVRNNHTSIVADVILEEDETEHELEEKEKDLEAHVLPENNSFGLSTWKKSLGHDNDKLSNEAYTGLIAEVRDMKDEAIKSEIKSQESDSEKLPEEKSSDDGSQRLVEENPERKKNVRSNLIHLLESDSESFQIEHGDAISGNEDSDFDFSFH